MKAFIIFLLPLLVFSWWDVGHMLTATIAQIHLKKINSEAFNKFNDLITSMNHLVDNRSRTFVECACWADDIKGYKYNMHLWDSWHFINKYHISSFQSSPN